MTLSVRNYWRRVTGYFRGNPRRFIPVVAGLLSLWFIFAYVTLGFLSRAELVSVSPEYYANVPTTDAVEISIPGFISPFIAPASTVTSDQGIPIRVTRRGNRFSVLPVSGVWAKGAKVTLLINRPGDFMSLVAAYLSPRGFGSLQQHVGSVTFVTAGPFTVLETYAAEQVNPSVGLVLRFNEHVANPGNLAQFISVKGVASVAAVMKETQGTAEADLIFLITSPQFVFNKSYELTVKAGVEAVTGEKLTRDVTRSFRTAANPKAPSVDFGAGQMSQRLVVLPDDGKEKAISLRFKNVKDVSLALYKATAADAINYLLYTQESDENYWNRESSYSARLAGKPKLWEEKIPNPTDGDIKLPASLSRGIYIIEAAVYDGDEKITTAAFLNVTGLGAVGKVGDARAVFWVSDLMSGQGVGNASVRLYRLRDGAVIQATGTGDDHGLIEMANPGNTDLGVVFAGEDTAFVPLLIPGGHIGRAGNAPELDDYWGGYPDPKEAETTKAYVATDRPLYKPGDTIHYKAIVRLDRDGGYRVPPQTPYTVALQRGYWAADEKPVMSDAVTTGEFGTVWGDFTLSEDIKPGNYYVAVKDGSKSLVTLGVVVADYRKPLYHLEAALDGQSVFHQGDTLKAKVTGTFSFGAPAKDKTVTWTLFSDPVWNQYQRTKPDPYDIKDPWGWDAEWWYDMTDYHEKQITSGTVTLNADGEGYISIPLTTSGLVQARESKLTFVVEIDDQGVAPEVAETTAMYNPTEYDFSVLSSSNNKESASMTTVLRSPGGGPAANREVIMKGPALLSDTTGKTNTEGIIVWDLKDKLRKDARSSDIIFTWKDGKNRTGEVQTSYWYSYYNDGDRSETGRSYLTEATVTFPDEVLYKQTPDLVVGSGGKQHLVVLERGDIVDAMVVDNDAKTPIPITDELMPNVFISTYSFRNGKMAQGYKAITPKDVDTYRFVTMTVIPDKQSYQPGDKAVLTVETKNAGGSPVSAEVFMAVVDKSIFDLKKSATKPIHPEFYRRRADGTVYGVSLSGIWMWAGGGRGGGGGGGGAAREIFADTAFVKKDIVTNEQGKATVEIILPDNLTTWVIDAHAVTKSTEVGAVHTEFTVSKPVFALPVYPSFLTDGDAVYFGSIIGNTSGTSQTMRASFALDDRAPQKDPTKVKTLADGSSAYLTWQQRVAAAAKSSSASLVVVTSPGGPTDAVRMDIPVSPQGKTVSSRISGIGATKVQPSLLEGSDSKKSTAHLTITAGILGYISEILSYQAGYPYGCVEQTMSRFYPSLLVSANLPQLTITNTTLLGQLPDMIEKGLARLAKFQHTDGGWGLWEDDASSVFNTAYVVGGLTQLGSKAPQGMLVEAAKYLETQAAKKLTPGETVVVLSALTKLKSPAAKKLAADLPAMTGLDDAEVAQAANALLDLRHEKAGEFVAELHKRAQAVSPTEVRWNAGKNYSYHPHENLSTAFAIQAMLKDDPKHEHVGKAMNFLNNHRNVNMYGSTYTNAQVVTAFVDYASRFGSSSPNYTAVVSVDGVEKLRTTVTGAAQIVGPIVIDPTKSIDIRQEGAGTLLWDLRVDNAFGALSQDRPSPDYKLSRAYTNLTHPGSSIKIGDLVRVTLTLQNTGGRDLHDIAIDDALPSGFEAVNTRLDNEKETLRGVKSPWGWYATEIHADRVVTFPYIIGAGRTEAVTYVARAFVAGTFTANPASAVLMYEPGIPALTKSEQLEILSE